MSRFSIFFALMSMLFSCGGGLRSGLSSEDTSKRDDLAKIDLPINLAKTSRDVQFMTAQDLFGDDAKWDDKRRIAFFSQGKTPNNLFIQNARMIKNDNGKSLVSVAKAVEKYPESGCAFILENSFEIAKGFGEVAISKPIYLVKDRSFIQLQSAALKNRNEFLSLDFLPHGTAFNAVYKNGEFTSISPVIGRSGGVLFQNLAQKDLNRFTEVGGSSFDSIYCKLSTGETDILSALKSIFGGHFKVEKR